jgi:hypothetical protein
VVSPMNDNPSQNEVDEGIKKMEERRSHLLEALESRKKAKEQIPYIQQDIDQIEWQLRALKARPPESDEIPFTITNDQLEEENKFIRISYPVLDVPFGLSVNSASSALTTSGSMGVYDYVNRVKDLGTPDAVNYGNTFISEYGKIQEAQQRPREVRELLEKLNSPNTLDRFDKALNAYQAYRSKSAEKTATANEMRNLLLGVRGDLFALARRWSKENMTWPTMSARLAINGGGGIEHVFLGNQQKVYASLNQDLTDILKDREGGSITDLDSIWTKLLDFLFAVMGLIA